MKFIIFMLFLTQSVDADFFLKFGMLERFPGFFIDSATGRGNYVGNFVFATEWLSKRYNFTYSIIPLGTDIGKSAMLNGSGSWSGATGRLLQGDFDILGPSISMTLARVRVFEFVGIADDEKSALLTPALTEQSPILSTLRPFQPTVWAMTITALLVVAFCFATTSVINNRGQLQWNLLPRLIGDYILHSLAIIANQGVLFRHFGLSFRLVGAAWCLFAVVMVNLYSSTLTSYITTRKMIIPPHGSFEVVEEGILEYLMLENGLGREIVLGATSGPLKKLGDVFRKRPENFIPNQETGFLKVASGCCAYSESVSYLEYRAAKDFKDTGKCRVHIGDPISGYGFGGLLLTKGHRNKDMINLGFDRTLAQTICAWQRCISLPDAEK